MTYIRDGLFLPDFILSFFSSSPLPIRPNITGHFTMPRTGRTRSNASPHAGSSTKWAARQTSDRRPRTSTTRYSDGRGLRAPATTTARGTRMPAATTTLATARATPPALPTATRSRAPSMRAAPPSSAPRCPHLSAFSARRFPVAQIVETPAALPRRTLLPGVGGTRVSAGVHCSHSITSDPIVGSEATHVNNAFG